MFADTLVILLTAMLLGAAGGLVGSFLVLRKMGMLADAISHAILPGLVLGFWITQGQSLLATFLGAILAGIVTVVLTELLHATRRVQPDAAIGITFASLFALGTFVVSRYFANVHLDADAVLYGEIAFAPFETITLGGLDVSRPLVTMAALAAANLVFVTLFYKELKLATFDAGLAASLGFAPAVVHYGLMGMVSLTTVGGFEAVGAIMAVTFLIVPAATAYLLTDRLPVMLALAVACGALAGVSGYYGALLFDVSISGMMTVMAGLLLLLAVLFAPAHGVVWRGLRRRRGAARVGLEDALRQLSQPQLVHASVPAETVDRLVRSGYAEAEPGGVRLTAAGDAEAARLTRVHRLWETYLAGEGVPLEAVHGDAHLMEHLLDREAAEALDEAIGYPALDPHGDPIPRPGRPASAAGVPLTGWPAGQPARITHLEDEPEEGLATLVRLGLAPGAVVTPLGRDDGRLRVRLGERELLVPADAAEQVQVVGLDGGEIS